MSNKTIRTQATDDDLGSLVHRAGRRPPLSETSIQALHAPSLTAWQYAVATQRTQRRRRLALAATFILAVGTTVWWSLHPTAPAVALVESVKGSVQVEVLPMSTVGAPVYANHTIETAATGTAATGTNGGRLALRLTSGHRVRLDHGTQMRLLSPQEIELTSGAIYVEAASDPLVVQTAWGTFRHLGTRFEVRIEEGAVRLRVRDGQVVFEDQTHHQEAGRGEELMMIDGKLQRRSSSPWDESWQWIHAVAPRFDVDGRSLREFLDWITAENGWTTELRDVALEDEGAPIVIHGSIQGLNAEDALNVVLSGSGFGYWLQDGRLVVQPLAADP